MPDPIPQPKDTPLSLIFRRLLEQAVTLRNQSTIPRHSFLSWTRRFRAPLIKIYGEDSPALEHFPFVRADVPPSNVSDELSRRISYAQRFVQALESLPAVSAAPLSGKRIFIGHGRSPLWRELKDFLADRLRLPYDEFNRESTAGHHTTDRLQTMLNEAAFAFLIMTAEEEHSDSTIHARPNVIHEIGLFQGRLGPHRAIVLFEEGCTEFSNIFGLTQIRFPRGDIKARFEEIRRVLEREGFIS